LAVLVSDATVYRSKSTRWLAGALSFVYALVVVTGANGLDGGVNRSSAVTAVGIVLIVCATAGILWCIFFYAQMGVVASEQGILVRNWFRRRSIPWQDIDEFRFGNTVQDLSVREQLSSPVLQTYVVTKSGVHYVMSGISATRINRSESRHRVQLILNLLEEERQRHVGDAH
jgi:hypothetical protein